MSKSLGLNFIIGAALTKSYFSTFDTAQQKTQKLGAAFEANDKRLKAANGVIKYKEKLAQLQQKQKAAGGGSKRLAQGIKAVELKYKEAKRAAKGYGISVGDVIKQQRKLSAESKKLETRLNRLNKASAAKQKLNDLKYKGMGIVGTAYAGSRLIGGAFQREDKVMQLGDVITGDNREARLNASLKNAKRFASMSLASENDVLEIDYSLRSSGLDDKAAMFGAKIVSKVATVTKGTSSQVGFLIGDTYMNMGATMQGTVEEKLTRIGDVLTKTKNLFSIKDFAQLGEGFKESLSGALANKLSLEQTSALVGQINNGMLKGSQAGTGLNAILRQMPKASDKLGFNIVRNESGELDMIETLSNLKMLLNEIDDIDERSMLIQKYFGDEGKKGLMPLLSGLDDLKKNFDEVQNKSNGTFDEGYQRRIKAASGQWTLFSQNINMAGTSLATTLLPSINVVLSPLAKLMGFVAEGIDEFPVVGYVIGGLATAFIAAGTGIGIVTAATWAWNVALAANPIGLVIGGVIALGAAVYAIYDNWDGISEWFGGLWDNVITSIESVGSFMKESFFSYHPLGMIIDNWGGITDYFKGMWGNIKSTFYGGVASVLQSFQGVSNILPDWALPDSLEASKIGDTIKKYQQLSIGALYKPTEDKPPKSSKTKAKALLGSTLLATQLVMAQPAALKLADLNIKPQAIQKHSKSIVKQDVSIVVHVNNPKSELDIERGIANGLRNHSASTSLKDEDF